MRFVSPKKEISRHSAQSEACARVVSLPRMRSRNLVPRVSLLPAKSDCNRFWREEERPWVRGWRSRHLGRHVGRSVA